MSKQIERQIEAIYKEVFKKVFSTSTIRRFETMNEDKIKNTILRLGETDAYERFAKKFSKELAKKGLSHERGIWRKYFDAAKARRYKVYVKSFSEFQLEQLKKATEHNFKMIKSIPEKVLKVYEQKYILTLREQVLEGSIGRGSFEKELRKQGHKNSKLIARTETAKLQTAIMENRARDLGSVAYIWLSSNDIRTRKSHREMYDVVVFWRNKDNEKPNLDTMWGNAGEFPNCRCSPEPILDEKDLTKSSYKVYDYRNHTIITMSKIKLIEALKKGEL